MTHNDIYWANTDRTAKRLALVRAAAETAVRLDPDLAEGHLALGFYYYWGLRDYDRALAEFSAALERQPRKRRDTFGARRLAASSGALCRGGGELRARGRARPALAGPGVQRRHHVRR